MKQQIMNAFGRPKIYDDMVINVCTLPNALRLDTFTKLLKRFMRFLRTILWQI
jgi:hypothetical protein